MNVIQKINQRLRIGRAAKEKRITKIKTTGNRQWAKTIITAAALLLIMAQTTVTTCNHAHAAPQFPWQEMHVEESETALSTALGWGCPIATQISRIQYGPAAQYMGWLNYFFPISQMAAMLTAWIAAIGIYYLASIVLRWVKAVS